MLNYLYDKDGSHITMEQRVKLLQSDDYKRVELTVFNAETYVSTVWLGLDHRFSPSESDQPLIFETMAFSNNKAIDGEQQRYPTIELARAGHSAMCRYVKNVLNSIVE